LPDDILLERNVRVPVRDGTLLAVDVYRPKGGRPRPAVLNCVPYRKDDLDARSDRALHPYLAGRGFVAIKADVRGTGSSEGIALDEYTMTEQLDYVDLVAWAAAQPWCTGRVGAWGLSYSGFNALQVAALAPPALGAVCALGATDDRYTDDVHYVGGALGGMINLYYQARMLALNALPPCGDLQDPELLRWWRERIEATPPWVLPWLREPTDGPYWRNGSVRPDYARIKAATMVVVGSRDGYRTASLRLVSQLRAPWQLVVGPWIHTWPDAGAPGPRAPFAELMTRWFDTHLGDAGEKPPRTPRTVFFVEESSRPAEPSSDVAGAWLGSERWPETATAGDELFLCGDGTLGDAPGGGPASIEVPVCPEAGGMHATWSPLAPLHLPADQRPDEARSAVFTSAPLTTPLEVFGEPVVSLRVAGSGLVVVKLADVSPDGHSQLVTSGILNLAHPGEPQTPAESDVEVRLLACSWRVRPGQRVRLAIASSDWPSVFPAATTEAVVLRIADDGSTRLSLPGTPSDALPWAADVEPIDMVALGVEGGAEVQMTADPEWLVGFDAARGEHIVRAQKRTIVALTEEGRTVDYLSRVRSRVRPADPASVVFDADATVILETPTGTVRSEARSTFTGRADHIAAELSVEVTLDGSAVARRTWQEDVPR
jgi:uncharacterized protein